MKSSLPKKSIIVGSAFHRTAASNISPVPGHIKDVLVSRYEFVVCERDALPDIQDELRLCKVCGDWCPG